MSRSFTVAELSVTIVLTALVTVLALPHLTAARRARNELAGIKALRSLVFSQTQFREQDLDKNGKYQFGTLEELRQADVIDDDVDLGLEAGYLIKVTPGNSLGQLGDYVWFATASPAYPGLGAQRHFGVNQGGHVFFNTETALIFSPPHNQVQNSMRRPGGGC